MKAPDVFWNKDKLLHRLSLCQLLLLCFQFCFGCERKQRLIKGENARISKYRIKIVPVALGRDVFHLHCNMYIQEDSMCHHYLNQQSSSRSRVCHQVIECWIVPLLHNWQMSPADHSTSASLCRHMYFQWRRMTVCLCTNQCVCEQERAVSGIPWSTLADISSTYCIRVGHRDHFVINYDIRERQWNMTQPQSSHRITFIKCDPELIPGEQLSDY